MRVLANAGKIVFCPDGCLYYRSNDTNSMSRSKPTWKKGEALLAGYVSTQAYLSGKGMLTERVKRGLVRAFQSVAYQYSNFPHIVGGRKSPGSIIENSKCKAIGRQCCFQVFKPDHRILEYT